MAIKGGTVRWEIVADPSEFNQSVDEAEKRAEQFGEKLKEVDRSASSTNFLSDTTDNVKNTSSALKGLANSIKNAGLGTFSASATMLTGALATLIRKGIQGTDFLETARTSMAGLTGSMEKGNKVMSIAAEFWQNNPFDRFTTTNAVQQLVQFGRTTQDITKDLEILRDVSLSTNTPLDELARYYARTAASGRAMTMDLEMMSDRGIPIYQKLQEITGKTTEQIREMASQSQISFDLFREAMEKAVSSEAMAEFENTLARQKDRLSGSISILAGDLAGYKIVNDQLIISEQGLEKAWTRLLKTLATGLRDEKMRAGLEKLGYVIAELVDKITNALPTVLEKFSSVIGFIGDHSETLIPILGGVLLMFGRLASQIPILSGVWGSFANVIGGDNGIYGHLKNLLTTKPLLAAFIALFGAGFINGMKNSEDFRASIQALFQSLGQLVSSLLPVLQTLVKVFVKLLSSKAVINMIQGVVKVLTFLVNVINKIPIDILTALISGLMMFKLINTNPLLGLITAIGILVGSIQELGSEMGGFQNIGAMFANIWNNITKGISAFASSIGEKVKGAIEGITKGFTQFVDFLAGLPKALLTIGHNVVVGLINGLIEGGKKAIDYARSLATAILNTFKNVLQIHSPSKAMEYIGKYVTLGLAEGINKNSSVVEKAIDSLATDILSLADTVIQNKKDFNILDVNGEYKAWKQVSKLFTKGSAQYEKAMQKMEDARKSVNLQILSLQNEYNDTLDRSINRISTMYGIFEKVDLSKSGMNSEEIIKNLDQQVAKLNEWEQAQSAIADLPLDKGFIEELQAMGVESVTELSAIATMSTSQLQTMNELWLKKQSIATKASTKQLTGLRNDTLNEIAKLKDGVDGETVEVVDIGGRLVSNIGDGITGALPTLEDSFAKLDDYIAEEMKNLSDSAGSGSDLADSGFEAVADAVDQGSKTTLEQIKTPVEGMAKGLVGLLTGSLGALIGGAVLKKFTLDKLFSGGLFGGKKAKTAQTESPIQSIVQQAQETTKATEQLNSTATQLTKAQNAMKTMRMGLVNLIIMAGAIASLAIALKIAYETIPDDILGLATKLGVMVVVVGAMAVLGQKIGELDKGLKDGLLDIVIIAGSLAVMAVALGAVNILVPDDLGLLSLKLIVMGVVLGALGALMALVGKFNLSLTEGLVAVTLVALALVETALALAIVNAVVPDNLEALTEKLVYLGGVLVAMGAVMLVAGLFVAGAVAGFITATAVALALVELSLALAVVYKVVPDDIEGLSAKLDTVGNVLWSVEKLLAIVGVLAIVIAPFLAAGLGTCLLAFAGLASLAVALRVFYETMPDDLDGIKDKVNKVAEVMGIIVHADFGNVIANIVNAFSIKAIEEIAISFATISKCLTQISKMEIDNETILEKVEKIKEVVKSLSELQAGDFWKNLRNAESTAVMTWTVENIHTIMTKLMECINILQVLETVSEGDIKGKVDKMKEIVGYFRDLEAGDFWNNLGNMFSTGIIGQTVQNIKNIIDKVAEIVKELTRLNNEYGDGKVEKLVEQAIEIMKQFAGIKLEDGSTGWFSETTYEKVAKGTESLTKTAEHINGIIQSTKGIVKNIEDFNSEGSDVEGAVTQAIEIMKHFEGVPLEDGKKGWFSANGFEETAKNLEFLKNTANNISSILESAKNIVAVVKKFNDENIDAEDLVRQAQQIIDAFKGFNITDEHVEKTATGSGHLVTTAENVDKILGTAKSIVEKIQEFDKTDVNVVDIVNKANDIIKEFAKLKVEGDTLEQTSKNAGFLSTTAENVDKILGTAKSIIEKIEAFGKRTIDDVKQSIKDANAIIECFGELNLNADKDFEKLSKNAEALQKTVGSVKEILENADTAIKALEAFNQAHPDPKITALRIVQINAMLKSLATIQVHGFEGDGATEVAKMTSLVEVLKKVKEVGEVAQSVPNVTENLTNLSAIIEFINEKMSNLPQAFAKYEETFDKTGQTYAGSFIKGWNSKLEDGKRQGSAMSQRVVAGLLAELNKAKDAGNKLQGSFWDAIEAHMQDEYYQGKALTQKVIDGVWSAINAGELSRAGHEVQGKFWSGIEAHMQDEFNQGRTLANRVRDGIYDVINGSTFHDAGANATQGFINGLSSKDVYQAGWNVANSVLAGIKTRGKQGSPWKTTMESGAWAVEGLIEGIESEESALITKAQNVADEVIEAFDMNDVAMSPELNASINPYRANIPYVMAEGGGYVNTDSKRQVVIEQTNNNYTNYSIDQVNRDLAWALSKV